MKVNLTIPNFINPKKQQFRTTSAVLGTLSGAAMVRNLDRTNLKQLPKTALSLAFGLLIYKLLTLKTPKKTPVNKENKKIQQKADEIKSYADKTKNDAIDLVAKIPDCMMGCFVDGDKKIFYSDGAQPIIEENIAKNYTRKIKYFNKIDTDTLNIPHIIEEIKDGKKNIFEFSNKGNIISSSLGVKDTKQGRKIDEIFEFKKNMFSSDDKINLLSKYAKDCRYNSDNSTSEKEIVTFN